ncbi:unnamed protein product [Ilex paraguariensis]|uniref:YTH domain-containing family protein n=1 Tax=Ilex paraguariensis TaxID=185542 RepID=A0ABC8UKD2_9AQUA
MAAVAPAVDQAADLLQKLSMDSQTKTLEIQEPTKKACVDTADNKNGKIQSFDRSMTPSPPDFMDPTMCYVANSYPTAYYYGGYDGTCDKWDDYSRFLSPDGVEMTPGAYGDNGSLMYHHGYGYAPYGPYSPAGSPVPTVAHDGQLYGAQHYQYPTPYFQPPTPTSGLYPSPAAPPKGEISTSAAADQLPLSVETANGNSNGIANIGGIKGNNGSAPVRPTYQNSSFNTSGSYGRGAIPGGIVSSGYQDLGFGFDGLRSPITWVDGSIFSDGQPGHVKSASITSPTGGYSLSRNQNLRPNSHLMGLQHPRLVPGMSTANGYINRMYPNKLYGHYGNTFRSVLGSNGYESRTNGRGWLAVDSKYKPRGRGNGLFGYGNGNMDGLNELNRGPRAKSSKNQTGFAPVALAVKGQNIPLAGTNDDEKEKSSAIPDRQQYNRADFPEKYTDAKFFIIKSYSEDDVHKSIKYNVWASTPHGNKKLDAAYQEALQKLGDCPIFLFFSVCIWMRLV